MKPQFVTLTVALYLLAYTASAQPPSGGVARVDGANVAFTLVERNLIVACVISELGQWKDLDSLNVKDKAAAITYVILRRTALGIPKKQHTVQATILALDQFYGITRKQPASGRYKGKPEVHAALASMDPAYHKEILAYAHSHAKTAYIRDILHLLPSDTAHGDDAMQFQKDLRAAQYGVDGALSGQEKDVTNGAVYFGGLPDLFKTKEHEPSRNVAVVGNLGPYPNVKALLNDPKIHSQSHRVALREKEKVDAIFFYK